MERERPWGTMRNTHAARARVAPQGTHPPRPRPKTTRQASIQMMSLECMPQAGRPTQVSGHLHSDAGIDQAAHNGLHESVQPLSPPTTFIAAEASIHGAVLFLSGL